MPDKKMLNALLAAKKQSRENDFLFDMGQHSQYGQVFEGSQFEKIAKREGWSGATPLSYEKNYQDLLKNYGKLDMLYDSAVGFVLNAVGGAIGSAASDWDMFSFGADALNKDISDSEEKFNKLYGSSLSRLGDSFQERSSKDFAVPQYADNAMWNLNYWAMQVQQAGTTLGIMAPMVAQQAALAYATKGAGNISTLPSTLAKLGKLGKVGKLISRIPKATAIDFTFHTAKAIGEAAMNARETQMNLYEELLSQGYTEEEAIDKASRAALLHYKTEASTVAFLNAAQNTLLFGRVGKIGAFGRGTGRISSGYSDPISNVAEAAAKRMFGGSKGIGGWLGTNAIKLVGVGGSEGVEEFIQEAIGKYATGEVTGKQQNYFDVEARDAFVGGVVGSLIMAGGSKAIGYRHKKVAEREWNSHIERLANVPVENFRREEEARENLNNLNREYNKNPTNANRAKVQEAEKAYEQIKLFSNLHQTILSLHHDYVKGDGSTGSFDSHVGNMAKILKAVEEQDFETLADYGLATKDGKENNEGSYESILNNFQAQIDDAYKFKEIYEDILTNTTKDFEHATKIATREYNVYKQEAFKQQKQEELDTMRDSNEDYNRLNEFDKAIFDNETEAAAIRSLGKLANADQRARLKELEEQRETLHKGYTKPGEHLRNKILGDFIAKQRTIEESEISYEAALKESIKNRSVKDLKNEYAGIIGKNMQKAKTIKELKTLEKQAKADGVLTPSLEKTLVENLKRIRASRIKESVPPEAKEKPERFTPEAKEEEIKKPEETEDFGKDMMEVFNESSGQLNEFDDTTGDNLDQQQDLQDTLDAFNDQVIGSRRGSKPTSYDQNKFVKAIEQQEKVRNSEFTFGEFIKALIRNTSLDLVQDNYNTITHAWESMGREVDESVYEQYFNAWDTMRDLLEANSEQGQTKEERRETEDTTKRSFNRAKGPANLDINGTALDNTSNQDRRRVSTKPNLPVKNQQAEFRDGVWIHTSANLQPDPITDNFLLLSKTFVLPGDTLELRAFEDPLSFRLKDEKDGKFKTFGQLLKDRGVKSTDTTNPIYMAYAPIGVYKDGKMVSIVTATEWFTEDVFNEKLVDNTAKASKDAQSNITNIRESFFKDGKNEVVVTERELGSIDSIDRNDNLQMMSIEQAAGDSSSIAVYRKGQFFVDGSSNPVSGVVHFDRDSTVGDTQNKFFGEGRTFELRPVYVEVDELNNEITHYIPLAVSIPAHFDYPNARIDPSPLNDTAFMNIRAAIIANLFLLNQNARSLNDEGTINQALTEKFGMTSSKAIEIQRQIRDTTGVDIRTDLHDYLKMYVRIFKGSKQEGLAAISDGATDNTIGMVYTHFEGDVGSKVDFLSRDASIPELKVSTTITPKKVAEFMSALEGFLDIDNGHLRNMTMNIDPKNLKNENSLATFDEDFNDTTNDNLNYSDYLKSHIMTGVKSHPVENENGDIEYVVDVQPMIYYESTDKHSDENLKTKAKEKAVRDAQNKKVETTETTVEQQIAQLREDLKNELSSLIEEKENIEKEIDDIENNPKSETEHKRGVNRLLSQDISDRAKKIIEAFTRDTTIPFEYIAQKVKEKTGETVSLDDKHITLDKEQQKKDVEVRADVETKYKDKLKESGIELEKENSIEETSEILSKLGVSGQAKLIWDLISKAASKLGVKVVFSEKENFDTRDGFFKLENNTFYVSAKLLKNITSNRANLVIVHETVHGVTRYITRIVESSQVVYPKRMMFTSKEAKQKHEESVKKDAENLKLLSKKQIKAVENLQELLKELKKDENLKEEYGVTNIDELLAELANEEFVNKLKAKKFKGNESFFDKIASYIVDLLGLDVSAYDIVYESLVALVENSSVDVLGVSMQGIGKSDSSSNVTELSQLKKRLDKLIKKINQIEAKYDAKIAALKEGTKTKIESPVKQKEKQVFAKKKKDVFLENTTNVSQEARDLALKLFAKTKDHFSSRRQFTAEDLMFFTGTNIETLIPGLSVKEQSELIDTLVHSIMTQLDVGEGKIKGEDLKTILNTVIEEKIAPIRDNVNEVYQAIKDVPELAQQAEQLKEVHSKLTQVIVYKNTLLGEKSKGKLTGLLKKIIGVNINELLKESESLDGQERSYSKGAAEIDLKMSYSSELKALFHGFEKLDDNGDPVVNELGIPQYRSSGEIYNKILELTTNSKSDFANIIKKLHTLSEVRHDPLYSQIANKLEKTSKRNQNEFLYNTIVNKHKMHSSLYSRAGKKKDLTRFTIIDSNDNSVRPKYFQKFRQSFLVSNLIKSNKENEKVLNKETSESLVKEIRALIKKHKGKTYKGTKENIIELKLLYDKMGINLELNTILEYIDSKGSDIFNTYDILHNFAVHLDKAISREGEVRSSDLTVLNDIESNLKDIINIDALFNDTTITPAIRMGDKTYQGTIPTILIEDLVRDLILEKDGNGKLIPTDFVRHLRSSKYSQDNMLLGLLTSNNDIFRGLFDVTFASPEFLKEQGGDSNYTKNVNTIDDYGFFIGELAYYSGARDNKKGLNSDKFPGLSLKSAQMLSPALSDKGRMLLFRTFALDLTADQVFDKEFNLQLNDNVLDLMTQQLYESEMKRILAVYKNNPEIKGFSDIGRYFIGVPTLNDMTIKIDEEQVSVEEYLENNYETITEDFLVEAFREQAKEKISALVNSEKNQKIDILVKGGILEGNNINQIDERFLEEKGKDLNREQTLNLIATEFTINSLLHNSNMYQLFAGDMAYFSKESFADMNSVDRAQAISEIVTKRIAYLIAPGQVLANSDSLELNKDGFSQNKFKHIQLEDVVSSSTLIESYIEVFYNRKPNKTEAKSIANLRKAEESGNKNNIKKFKDEIKKSFPKVANYLNIEGTDAQEYTTWRYHIDLLFRQGRLEENELDLLNSAYTKLNEGTGNLSTEELAVVLTPIKPVYTGFIPLRDANGEVYSMRPIYIKSSSFPLLPQTTSGLKLDSLRKQMETMENTPQKDSQGTKLHVKASYGTANKVGATNNPVTMNEIYSENSLQRMEESSLELNYNNLRIQQDTPYGLAQSLAQNEDSISVMGSQIWKIILGNGINKIEEKIFPNEFSQDLIDTINETLSEEDQIIVEDDKISGKDLDKLDFFVFERYSEIKKNALYERLGITDDLNNIDTFSKNKVIDKLVKILKEEIESRDYPDYLLDVVAVNTTEEQIEEFLMPLMFDANSNKFESLLLSLVTNNLVKHKLPGSAHIVGSSEGFEISSFETASQELKNKIVWIDGVKRDELKTTTVEGSDVINSEVIIESHFKIDTLNEETGEIESNLIDLTSPEYSTQDENGFYMLDTSKIDPRILQQFTYRIPTSAHQSGAIIKVVGFLPHQQGDLMLVPREHTVQLGEDYDVDKRYVYKENYRINKEGVISPIEYNIEDFTNKSHYEIQKEYNKRLRDTKESIKDEYADIFSEKLFDIHNLKFEIKSLEREYRKELETQDQNNVSTIIEELKIRKDELEILQNEYDLATEQSEQDIATQTNFLDVIFSYEQEEAYFKSLINVKSEQKMLENAQINIYKSVYTSPDTRVQSNIMKALSLKNAKETTDIMEKKVNIRGENFSPLSSIYQREQVKKAADGQLAISMWSNGVTLHAQMQRSSKPISLKPIRNEKGQVYNDFFGNQEEGIVSSDGLLGRIKTLDEIGEIADALTEGQNSGVDNINEGIMGKRNENTETISSIIMMALKGLDMNPKETQTDDDGKTRLQLVSLFLNQPIIREYVDKLSSMRGEFNEFIEDVEIKAAQAVASEYIEGFMGIRNDEIAENDDVHIFLDPTSFNSWSSNITSQSLYDNLEVPDGKQQLAILQKFLFYKQEFEELSGLQQLMNLHSSGMGISFFEVIARIDTLDKIVESEILGTNRIENGSALIGEFSETEKPGFTQIGQYYWKPTTKEGVMLIDSIEAATKIMDFTYLYNSDTVKGIIQEIFDVKELDITSNNKKTLKLKYSIMRSMKDYLNSTQRSGMFEGSVNEERNRLFLSTETKDSLAEFIVNAMEENPYLASNEFMKSLKFNLFSSIHTIMQPIDNDSSFTRVSYYDSFKELLTIDTPIGEWNGETITGIELAADLASAAMLSSEFDGALGFRESIPVDYLERVGFTEYYRNIYSMLEKNIDTGTLFDNFLRQFMQHEPSNSKSIYNMSRADFVFRDKNGKQITEKEMGKQGTIALIQKGLKFTMAEGINRPKFLNFKSRGEFNLFELGEDGMYHSLETVQEPHYNKYDITLEKAEAINPSLIKAQEKGKTPNLFEHVKHGNKATVLFEYLRDYGHQDFSEFISKLEKVVNKNTIIKYTKDQALLRGSSGTYKAKSNIIYLDADIQNILNESYNEQSHFVLTEILTEELFHSITVTNLLKELEIDKSGNVTGLKENATEETKVIYELFLQAQKSVPYNKEDGSTYYSKNIFEFVAGIWVAPDYRAKLDEANPGFMNKLFEAVKNFFKNILTNENVEFSEASLQAIEVFLNNRLEFTKPEATAETKSGTIKPVPPTKVRALTNLHLIDKILTQEEAERIAHHMLGGEKISFKLSKDLLQKDKINLNKVLTILRPNFTDVKQILAFDAFSDFQDLYIDPKLLNKTKAQMSELPTVIENTNIITSEGTRGAAQYNREANTIEVDRPLLREKFAQQAWTNPRLLIETLHGTQVESKANPLHKNTFKTYEEFEAFVIEHERQHSLYSREDFNRDYPNKTKGDYETHINDRAINTLGIHIELEEPNKFSSNEFNNENKFFTFKGTNATPIEIYNFIGTNINYNVINRFTKEIIGNISGKIVKYQPKESLAGDIYYEFLLDNGSSIRYNQFGEVYTLGDAVYELNNSQPQQDANIDQESIQEDPSEYTDAPDGFFADSRRTEFNADQIIEQMLDTGEITYTSEDNTLCALKGAKTSSFTSGGTWAVIKDFKGASHAKGGIDIEIHGNSIKMSGKQGKFEAKFGVVIPKENII